MRTCTKCHVEKEDTEFHANNVTGWSRHCVACRKKKLNAKYQRNHRVRNKLKTLVDSVEQKRRKRDTEKLKKRLRKQFNQFTLVNRWQLKRLQDKLLAADEPDLRTTEAVIRRTAIQAIAYSILQKQLEDVAAGKAVRDIQTLWRIKNGDNAGEESQDQDHPNP